MEVSYLGKDSVRVAGRGITLVSNPQSGAGKKSTADVSLITSGGADVASGLVLDSPGEYEVKGVMITGVTGPSYVIQADNGSVGVLGAVGADLDAEASEQLSELDALVVPLGAQLDAEAAATLIGKLEPKYVLPITDDTAQLKKLLEELGAADAAHETKLKLGKELPEEMTVVVLDPVS